MKNGFVVRRRAAVAAAILAAGFAAPAALAAYGNGPEAPPANLPPTQSAAVISTAVNGLHIVRANLADKYTNYHFLVTIGRKVVARGVVHEHGRFMTWFRGDLSRGTVVAIKVITPAGLKTVVTKRS